MKEQKRIKKVKKSNMNLIFSGRGNNKNDDYLNLINELRMGVPTDVRRNPYFHYGYECEGSLLYGFSKWLNDYAGNIGVKKLFFLSRDGYLMQLSYNELFGFQNKSIHYLYVSRRSLHLPLFKFCKDLSEYLSFNGVNKRWSFSTICNRLGISREKYIYQWKKLGFKENESFKVEEINNNTKFAEFYNSVYDEVYEYSCREYIQLIKYLEQNDFVGDIGIVDSGGYGTTQKCLDFLISKADLKVNIRGFYIWGSMAQDERHFIYCNNVGDHIGGDTIVPEIPLTAFEGTVINYHLMNNVIKPVLDEYEYSDDRAIESAIKDIQTGCLYAIKVLKAANVEISANTSCYNCLMISRYPRQGDIRIFKQFFFQSDRERTYLAKPKSLIVHVIHTKQCLNEFKLTRWKIGYLKALFHLPLPYYRILRFLKVFLKI